MTLVFKTRVLFPKKQGVNDSKTRFFNEKTKNEKFKLQQKIAISL